MPEKKKRLEQQQETMAIVVKNKVLFSSYTGESFRGYLLANYFFRFPLKQSSFTVHKLISTFWALLHYESDMDAVLQK